MKHALEANNRVAAQTFCIIINNKHLTMEEIKLIVKACHFHIEKHFVDPNQSYTHTHKKLLLFVLQNLRWALLHGIHYSHVYMG
jgi:hypothetical protein